MYVAHLMEEFPSRLDNDDAYLWVILKLDYTFAHLPLSCELCNYPQRNIYGIAGGPWWHV